MFTQLASAELGFSSGCVVATILPHHRTSPQGQQPEISSLGDLSASSTLSKSSVFLGHTSCYEVKVGFNPQGLHRRSEAKYKFLFHLVSLPRAALWWKCYGNYEIKVAKKQI